MENYKEVCDENCPYFVREGSVWNGSPEFWERAKERHEKHSGKNYCPHCGRKLNF